MPKTALHRATSHSTCKYKPGNKSVDHIHGKGEEIVVNVFGTYPINSILQSTNS